MSGLLLPLVLAAVLSIVAVTAARSDAPPRPAPHVRLPRRGLAAAGIAAATAAGLLAIAGQGAPRGGPAHPSSPAPSESRAAR